MSASSGQPQFAFSFETKKINQTHGQCLNFPHVWVKSCWNMLKTMYCLTPIQLLSISSSEAEAWGSGSNVFSASPFEWHRLFHHWFHQRKKKPAVQCKTCRTWIVIDIIIDMSLSRIATIKREKRVITHNTRFNSFSMHNAFHLHSINMKIISPFLLWHKIVVLDVRKQIKKIQCMNITIVAAYIVWLYINIKSICLLFTTFLFFPYVFQCFCSPLLWLRLRFLRHSSCLLQQCLRDEITAIPVDARFGKNVVETSIY